MQIILHTEEFNEAVRCYLNTQGFREEEWIIETRVVQGRNGNEPRAEITLTKKNIKENIEVSFNEGNIDKKEDLDFLKRQD